MAMIELAIATLLGFAALVSGVTMGYKKASKLMGESDWAVRRKQLENRKRIETESKFRCNEHKRLYARGELVANGNALYCPECYRQHIYSESTDSKVITDLGEIHKELGLK